MTAQERIELVFKGAHGQSVGRRLISVSERAFQFLDFRPLRGGEFPPSQLLARVFDLLQQSSELTRGPPGCRRGIVKFMSQPGGKLSQSRQTVALLFQPC